MNVSYMPGLACGAVWRLYCCDILAGHGGFHRCYDVPSGNRPGECYVEWHPDLSASPDRLAAEECARMHTRGDL